MQITNSVVCGASKCFIYRQIKPHLVGEHAFPLTGVVCKTVHVTFGGSGGIMTTASPELPYPCNSQAKSRHHILCHVCCIKISMMICVPESDDI